MNIGGFDLITMAGINHEPMKEMMLTRKKISGWRLVIVTSVACLTVLVVAVNSSARTKPVTGDTPIMAIPRNAVFSPDHTLAAHLGPRGFADGLYILNLVTREDKLILKDANGLNIFSNLTFSPDGSHLMFLASGPTAYYPGNVFTVRLDGSELIQLTDSTTQKELMETDEETNDYDVESASLSPDGKRIMIELVYGKFLTIAVGVISANIVKQNPKPLADGEPLFWNKDGSGIYYRSNDETLHYLALQAPIRSIPLMGRENDRIVGRIPGTDTVFVVKNDRNVNGVNCRANCVLTVESLDGAPVNPELTKYAASIPVTDSEGRTLSTIETSDLTHFSIKYEGGMEQEKRGIPQQHTETMIFPSRPSQITPKPSR